MIYIVNNVDNVDNVNNVDTTTLNNNSNSIILLSSNNSFTLSTKVKRAYVTNIGSTSTSKILIYSTRYYIDGQYWNIIQFRFTNDIQEFIDDNQNSLFLVNVAFTSDELLDESFTSSDTCITGFLTYNDSLSDGRIFYNGHQSSFKFMIKNGKSYLDFNESYITWENIPSNKGDQAYSIKPLNNIIDPEFSSTEVIPFSGIVYYRLEMIVYEG